ncbi:MAG: transcriptional regulator HexR [Telmatospirillum sp.]|nr:transcriptional regulator HexR [Telmatospirillum sp.]
MTSLEGSLFDRIRNARDQMRPSERKVADYILSQPDKAVSQGISAMAAESGISDPTVLRFCRAIGYDGFQDFKLGLAQSIAVGTVGIHHGIELDDRAPTLASKICAQTISAVNDLAKTVDWDQVERATDVLAAAARIEFHGAGASGAVAIDAQHKFFRLNVPTVAYVDPHMQIMSAASLTCGDALVSFSYTGRAREVVNAARLARQREASVIAVTTPGTALAEIASHPICLPVIENTEQYTPMTSRLLQLVVVDILEVGVALRRGPSLSHHLRRLKDALLQARLDPSSAGN